MRANMCEGMWLMLQQDEPDDYVLATGETTTVRQFVDLGLRGCRHQSRMARRRRRRKGLCSEDRQDAVVEIDPRYFRPTEVELLIGDPPRPTKLGWTMTTSVRDLCAKWSRKTSRSCRPPR
jgi:GDPmannose 4,6-dehydratase